jgi:DNA polymerase-3 subunit beta
MNTITIEKSAFLNAINAISGAVSGNPIIPIIEGVKFETIEGNLIQLSATNLDLFAKVQIPYIGEEQPINVCINHKIIGDTLKTIGDQPLLIRVGNGVFEIQTTSGLFKVPTEDGADFPKMQPDKTDAKHFEINETKAFLKVLHTALQFTSSDDVRPVMCGVFLKKQDGIVDIVSTDAHGLFRHNGLEIGGDDFYFIMPKSIIKLLEGFGNAQIVGKLMGNNIEFSSSDTTLVIQARLIDGKYPDYQHAIPQNNLPFLAIEVSDFKTLINQVSNYANANTNRLVVETSGGVLKIDAADFDKQNEANVTQRFESDFENFDLKIGLSSKYLSKVIAAMDKASSITINGSVPERAVTITDSSEPNALFLVMPIMIN